jgi:anti-anti-sigma factor
MCSAEALGSAIQDMLRAPRSVDVVVDLARVTFLDCVGIRALLAGRTTAVSRGRGYTVVNPQRQVRLVMELTGVFDALTGCPESGPGAGRAARYRRSVRRRDERPVATDLPAPSAAGVSALT